MIPELLVGVAASLTANAIDRHLLEKPGYFDDLKIRAKVNEMVVSVMKPMEVFLVREGLVEADVERLLGIATPLVEDLLKNQEFILSRGLDSERITQDVLSEKMSKKIQDSISDYPSVFEHILRALIDLTVRLPPTFADWEKSQFSTIFNQIDELKITLNSVYAEMQRVAESGEISETLFDRTINHRATSVALKINIHGLRKSPVPQTELDNFFVEPEFRHSTEMGEGRFEDLKILVRPAESIIVRAPAGAGKTTWSHWFSSELLKCKKKVFPIVLPLRSIIKKEVPPDLYDSFSDANSNAFKKIIPQKDVVKCISLYTSPQTTLDSTILAYELVSHRIERS